MEQKNAQHCRGLSETQMKAIKIFVVLTLIIAGFGSTLLFLKDRQEKGFIKGFLENPASADDLCKKFEFRKDSIFEKELFQVPVETGFWTKHIEKYCLKPIKIKCGWGRDENGKRQLGTCSVINRNGDDFIEFNFDRPDGSQERISSIVVPHYINHESTMQ